MPATIDPAVSAFVEKISASTEGLADSIAALLLKLAVRVSSLERVTEQQAQKLERLAKRPQPAPIVPLAPIMTGIDVASGAPVRIEPTRSRGRPPGSKDRYDRPRRARHHSLQAEGLDNGWDDLGAG